MILYTPPRPATSIPVIDFTGSFSSDPVERQRVAWEVHKACRETGFFYVSQHRVPAELVASQFECAKRFFSLPLEQKLALHMKKSPSAAGYEPVGGQTLDSQDPDSEKAPPDLKEGFFCGMELEDDHPLAKRRLRRYGHNQWPSNLPGFREQFLAYQAALRSLGDRVLAMLALSISMPEDFFTRFYDMPSFTLGVLHYSPHPANARFNQLGAGAHTDWGAITILAQDDTGGLEVRNAADEWIEAAPVPGTFVINLGDLMQRWTNGLYRSNMHRVKNRSTSRDRYSVPFFYGPRPDALIECMPTCIDAENPARFPPCTAAEHNEEMFLRSYEFMRTALK